MEELKNNKSLESYNSWIDDAQILKRYLETTKVVSPESSSEYELKLKAYENIIDELKARKSSFSQSPMLEAQADELLNEFEKNKSLFEQKLSSF